MDREILSPYRVVLVSVGSKEEGVKIARGLLRKKLAACVNIIPGIESHFWWAGKIDKAAEHLLVIKSRREKISRLTQFVVKQHSYDVCEVISLPIAEGGAAYLRWIDLSMGKAPGRARK
ncbi:MAG: divalent-cation tolerance protein CutA [Elusimicrobia bacterium]|nr:divalent-cation tolerance protein CutA [Elusimicrobiota bacterium]